MYYKSGLFFVDSADFTYFITMKRSGFTWFKKQKIWATPFASVAKKMFKHCQLDESVCLALDKIKDVVAMSHDLGTNDVEVNGLYPFQVAGVRYIKDRLETIGSVLIADEMGLGKTIEAIEFVNVSEVELKKILIVCPASLKDNWRNEWKKFCRKDVKPVIINYERLVSQHEMRAKVWDLIICDEIHYIKNSQAKRTQAIVGFRSDKGIQSKYKIGITGTPIPNRPVELFAPLKWLLPYGFSDKMAFARRFCDLFHDGIGYNTKGASNLDELQDRLRSTIMLRRRKIEVLPQLPSKTRQIIEIEPTDRMKELLQLEQRLIGFTPKDTISDLQFREVVQKFYVGSGPSFENYSKTRSLLAELKIPLVIEHIEDLMEEEDKLLVFGHHQKMIDAVQERFSLQGVKLTGKTALKNRQKIVDDFQTNRKTRVFVGNIKAAGVGYTLTAAHNVVFAECDFVPGNMTQAEDRVCRIGQTEKVLIQYLVVSGSLDALMCKNMVKKQKILDQALDCKWDFLEN